MDAAHFDHSKASDLLSLTGVANQQWSTLFLPNGWQLLYKYASTSTWHGGGQYFLAKKNINGKPVCALIMGARWVDLIPYYLPQVNHQLVQLNQNIISSTAASSEAMTLPLHHTADAMAHTLHLLSTSSADPGAKQRELYYATQAMKSHNQALKNSINSSDATWSQLAEANDELANTLEKNIVNNDSPHEHIDKLTKQYIALRTTSTANNNSPTSASVDFGFQDMYFYLRHHLWSDIQQVKTNFPEFKDQLPLWISGLGPAAPLALFASLDLRTDKSNSLVTELDSYLYSCPAFGNQVFANYVETTGINCFRVQATGDLFPDAPNQQTGYYQAGEEHALDLRIPTYDAPWVERDASYYASLLDSQASTEHTQLPIAENFTLNKQATSYDQTLAFALGQLIAVVYQQTQHPGSSIAFRYAPYELKETLTLGENTWVGLFESPSHLVVAIRGSITWQELMNEVSDTLSTQPDWLPNTFGRYSRPLTALYQSARTLLRDKLNHLSDKPVLIAGHGCGGALANLIATDLVVNPIEGARTLTTVYTYGVTPAADFSFVNSFNKLLANKNIQLLRAFDVLPKITTQTLAEKPGTFVYLNGGDFDPNNGSTYHAITTYLAILNPGG